MITLETIIEELKEVPADKLEDLYSIVRFLKSQKNTSTEAKAKILSFAGAFSDMSQDDYDEFISNTAEVRNSLFDRETKI